MVRHLLAHTAGLPHGYVADGLTNRDEAVRAIRAVTLEWRIGEGYHYSNDGYNLLATVVEVASDKTFDEYLRAEIFKPAGMKQTGFWGYQDNTPVASIANTQQLRRAKPTVFREGKSIANWGYRGATGLYSTTTDLFRLISAMRAGSVLSKNSRELMRSPHAFVRHDPQGHGC